MGASRKRKLAVMPEAVPSPDRTVRDPALYINRELSLLRFQERVLEEARDPTNPVLERVKFLSIVGSNLDEFFMVRVAGLLAQVEAGTLEVGPDGMSPTAQLVAIRREVKKISADARRCWQEELLPALQDKGIDILDYADLKESQRAIAEAYFHESIFPVLTPLAVDPGRPFPHISNLSLNLAILIRDDKGVERFARLKVPSSLPQFVPVYRITKKAKRKPPTEMPLVWLEQLIAANLEALFSGMHVVAAHPFHVTRDADIEIKELEADDLLETVEEGVRQRRFGSVVRLIVTDEMPEPMLEILRTNLDVEGAQVFRVRGPVGLSRLMSLYKLDRPELKDPPFVPAVPDALQDEDEDWFAAIRRSDILLNHPFDSFQPVVDLVRKAAHDPGVLAIKMTLYRVGQNSPIVDALLEAMENEKQVAVLVELKARFDEESNIEWARALEREGVHIVYGLVGLKIHCKSLMIVRLEGDTVRRYVHLATGNYNVVTSHVYTDIGLFTCDEDIAADTTDLFNYLTGYSAKTQYRKLLVAPVNLRTKMEQMIRREIEHANAGESAHLIFKTNALEDPQIIRLLYLASQAGVKCDLLVRGICCLRPGLPGVSDNIRVISIVGRFLEHSRMFFFRNGGNPEIYVGSADLMPRNLNRRVEVIFPVDNSELSGYLRECLAVYLADNVKAREMQSDGSYVRKTGASPPLSAQEWFVQRARSSKRTV